jgi:hypothetical protein
MLVNSSELRAADFPLVEVRSLQLDMVSHGWRRTRGAVVIKFHGVGNSTFILSVENDNDFRSRCECLFRHFRSSEIIFFQVFWEKKIEKNRGKKCLGAPTPPENQTISLFAGLLTNLDMPLILTPSSSLISIFSSDVINSVVSCIFNTHKVWFTMFLWFLRICNPMQSLLILVPILIGTRKSQGQLCPHTLSSIWYGVVWMNESPQVLISTWKK